MPMVIFMNLINKTLEARKFCNEVRELSIKYNLPFFIVTEGASAINNNGCEAVRNARLSHEKWEEANNIDSKEDWSEDFAN